MLLVALDGLQLQPLLLSSRPAVQGRCLLDVLCINTKRDPFPALPSLVCHSCLCTDSFAFPCTQCLCICCFPKVKLSK